MLKTSPNLNLYMLINVMLIKKTNMYFNSFVTLPRVYTTPVDCAHRFLNKESGIRGETGKFLQNY